MLVYLEHPLLVSCLFEKQSTFPSSLKKVAWWWTQEVDHVLQLETKHITSRYSTYFFLCRISATVKIIIGLITNNCMAPFIAMV